MDRREWLRKLQLELYKLPRGEIDDAIAYYTEYFEEAGPEREQEIIRELGDPAKVAAQIKADYAVRQLDEMERDETRWRWGRKAGGRSDYGQGYDDGYAHGERAYKEHRTRIGAMVAAIIGGILAAPIAIPLAICLVVFAVLGMLLLAGLVVAAVGLAFGGVVAGVVILISSAYAIATGTGALIVIGIGLLCIGGGVLLGFLAIKAAMALTGAIARAISDRRRNTTMAGGYQPGYTEDRGRNDAGRQEETWTAPEAAATAADENTEEVNEDAE